MKLKLSQIAVACLCTAMLLLESRSASAAFHPGTDSTRDGYDIKAPVAKTTRLQTSRNNDAVRIFPDVLRRTMHVVAKDNDGKQIDFFVFDLEGTMMHHFKMKPRDHERLTGMERGKYIYRVFAGDEETAAGNLEIR